MRFMTELMVAGWFVGYSMAGVVGMEEMMMDRNLETRFPGYLAAKAMLPQIQARMEVIKRAADIPVCLPPSRRFRCLALSFEWLGRSIQARHLFLLLSLPQNSFQFTSSDLSVAVPLLMTILQISTQALAGIAAVPVTQTGDSTRPFQVGNNTFTTFEAAVSRSCSDQHNDCAVAANAKSDAGLTVGQCDTQQSRFLFISFTKMLDFLGNGDGETKGRRGSDSGEAQRDAHVRKRAKSDTKIAACLSSNKNAVVSTADGSATTSSAATSTTVAAQPTLQSSNADFFIFCDA